MNKLFSFADNCWGRFQRRRANVDAAAGSSIRWWGLNARGGHLRVGAESIVRCRVDFDSPAGRVAIGDRCFIGASHLVAHTSIEIGDDVIISWGVTIVDHDSHSLRWDERSHDVRDWALGRKDWTKVAIAPVKIEDRVWIGFGASVLKGVTLGSGSVIGARAVVTRDVPPNTVVAGNPARTVRQL